MSTAPGTVAPQGLGTKSGDLQPFFHFQSEAAKTLWPGLTEGQVDLLARKASDVDLDLALGEMIWAYDRPYVTIKGLLRLLNRHPQYDHYELEPAGEEVRRAMRALRDDEQVWVCRMWRKDRTRPAIGYGRATPEDTAVGYGRAPGPDGKNAARDGLDEAVPTGAYQTPATAEMAQERAMRRAAQGAFALGSQSQACATTRRGALQRPMRSPASTPAQQRRILALVEFLHLPEGKVDEASKKVIEDGWKANLFRLFGKTDPNRLTAVEAEGFLQYLTNGDDASTAPSGEEERQQLWGSVQQLLASLPGETPHQVCQWLRRECAVELAVDELGQVQAPLRVSVSTLRRLLEGLRTYETKLAPEG